MYMSTQPSDTSFSVKVFPPDRFPEEFSLHRLLFRPLGVLGIKVKIMLPWDPNNKNGPKRPLPDNVSILEPKDESHLYEEMKAAKIIDVSAPPMAQVIA